MWTPNHLLYGAQLRFERADHHLAELSRMLTAWSKDCENNIVRDDKGDYRFNGWPDIPLMMPLVVSDIVNNLRSALDYIIYQLAIEDSGSIQEGTQFLIKDVQSDATKPNRGFNARYKQCLKGLKDPDHVRLIEMFQPYNGCQWTKPLRDISNSDKHRKLSVLTKDGRPISYTTRFHDAGRFESESRFHTTSEGPVLDRFDIEVDGYDTIAIAMPDGSEPPVYRVLRDCEAGVNLAIETFKPEFKI